jgi:hypothetical protein
MGFYDQAMGLWQTEQEQALIVVELIGRTVCIG